MTTFADVAKLARRLGPEEFVRQFPDAALLIDPSTLGQGEAVGLQLETVRADDLQKAVANALQTDPRLEWLRKRSGANAFMSMITIGRALNNDVVLDARGVSKFHAYIMRDPSGGFVLVDAGSTFGTTLAGKKLPPRDRCPIVGGAELVIGGVRASFHTPATLHAAVLARSGPRPKR